MGDDDRVILSVRLPPDLHRAAKRKMVDDDQTFQAIFEAAVQTYVNGDTKP
jgi:hypothetical protein